MVGGRATVETAQLIESRYFAELVTVVERDYADLIEARYSGTREA